MTSYILSPSYALGGLSELMFGGFIHLIFVSLIVIIYLNNEVLLSQTARNMAHRVKRDTYMICVIHRSLNAALIDYKKRMCDT
jgi:hypothetical protein